MERILVLPGDGVGPEVTEQARRVLATTGDRFDIALEFEEASTFLIDKSRKVFFAKVSKTHGGRTKAAEMVELVSSR